MYCRLLKLSYIVAPVIINCHSTQLNTRQPASSAQPNQTVARLRARVTRY